MNEDDIKCTDKSSALFPYPFIFRNRIQLNEHISKIFTTNRIVQYPKMISGFVTLILPLFNVFTIYRNVIGQREDFEDTYSIFHSIIFYGEILELHLLILIFLGLFLFRNWKSKKQFRPSKGQWIYFLDIFFTLMTFGMLKLIPIISTNGFHLLFIQIHFITPIIRKYSKSFQIIAFLILLIVISIECLFLFTFLILLILVKVYQLSFVGKITNPWQWTRNQWFLFIGFSGNIINLSDIPTISQISFMWDISNQNWSSNANIWSADQLAETRKIYLFTQISQTLGFIKGFLWLRSMSASDLHSLIRLPPSLERI